MLLVSKIKNPTELKRIILGLRRRGKRIVFTNGCFDLLHLGHVIYLEDAKRKGDILVVGVNRDASVRRLKGKNRPLVKDSDRACVIAGLQSVDFVCLFGEDTPLSLIKLVRPDILVKGADWKNKEIVGKAFVNSYGGKALTIKFIKGRSTTGLIKKIAKANSN